MLDPAAVDAWIDVYAERIGPKQGAKVVAKAWVDPDFKQRLLDEADVAIRELGYEQGHLIAVENTDDTHNVVVCTLCSCYPHVLLGMPPNWYKMAAYRSRTVRDPRGVLAEFGVNLDGVSEVKVWDSTAELRYMVIPQRPAGTDDFNEEQLAELVTRNSMIGTDRHLQATT